ncbi:MAG: YihY/virulence factor BrkB family protein [Acidimicrobiales bacterium]
MSRLTADDGVTTRVVPVALAVKNRINRHSMVVMAAGIAFYGLLALVPSLVAIVSAYGLINQGNEAEITNQIEDAAGSLDGPTKDFVIDQLTQVTTSDGNIVALVLGLGVALYSVSGAVQKTMRAVATAYEAEEHRSGVVLRIVAFGFTLAAVVGVVLIVILIGVIPAVLANIKLGSAARTAINILRFPVFAVLFAGAMSVLYRYGPDREPRTRWFNLGSIVATVSWILMAIGFSIYATQVGTMPASYGVLGTVAVLMVFLQLTSLAVIIGAELNAELEERWARVAGRRPAASARTVAQVTAPPEPVGFVPALAATALLVLLGRRD